jgi:hypothetical protein
LIAPNSLSFVGDITAFAPGDLRRTFSTFELGADGVGRGDYSTLFGDDAWQLSLPE